MLILGPPGKYRSRSATAYALGHLYELQSYLQMAATGAGFGGTQERISYKPRLIVTRASLGSFNERYKTHCGQLLLILKI